MDPHAGRCHKSVVADLGQQCLPAKIGRGVDDRWMSGHGALLNDMPSGER
jgi:hypothetical protein